ncbi:NUDIX hydrolase [Dyadobacter psychrotolerans]|uniref:NUDIX domain-containing protein n=1 Tax=Dyadobacter psychrotolerans TaxID=2541721 RepID=A0A4R5DVX9_9BACT|nr:NUDIX hydrolase [Dyadobacter psychrotolerans]TDE16301.1 NUDIX domain-containing protein [Dyadobacter psychrotolerans]
MKRNSLLTLLNTYTTSDKTEQTMCQEIKDFVNSNPECFERTLLSGHVTASGWIVSEDRAQVLLMHHRKLDRWFQPGGHCDGDSDVLEVAKKEVEEETGLQSFKLVQEGIFDVDIHLIPANSKDQAHYHYDIRFLFEAHPDQELVINIESKDVRWIRVQEIQNLNDSESIMRMVRKTTAL